MKKLNHIRTLSGILPAMTFGLFLLAGTLVGSDFYRALYKPPNAATIYWPRFDSLNANLVYNTRGMMSSLAQWLDTLDNYGLKAIPTKPSWSWDDPSPGQDTIPYLVNHYAMAQYNQYQAEWDSNKARYELDDNGSGYYHFWHGPDAETVYGVLSEDGQSWYLPDTISGNQAMVLRGLRQTMYDGYIHREPDYDYPWNYKYFNTGRSFHFRARARADTAGCDPDANVLKVQMNYLFLGTDTTWESDDIYFQVSNFGDIDEWTELSVEKELTTSDTHKAYDYIAYKVWYYPVSEADCWIDWIEAMDGEQAYPFLWDLSTQDDVLQTIVDECSTYHAGTNGEDIGGWYQSDEPRRISFKAHGVVNDYLKANGVMDDRYCVAVLNESWDAKRADHFAYDARPLVFDVDIYPYKYGTSTGNQVELDTLAKRLERVYQACGDTVDTVRFHFTGQAHDWKDNGIWDLRNPTGSEIKAETFMALAHGAQGISYFKYQSHFDSTENDTCHGLVDLDYNHSGELYSDKWDAVKGIFVQLDSIGDILLELDRDAAFCVQDDPNAFVDPITGVQFNDWDNNYIEVGQFHRGTPPNDTSYLILVNRRTNADKQIDVKTNLIPYNGLRDIYTQELFLSSTGNFEAIPFDSGEGRVFRIEENFNDWDWSNSDRIVLADTVMKAGINPLLSVAAGCTIRATQNGMLYMNADQQLDCNGINGNEVVFTALQPDSGWKGILFTRPSQPDPPNDTLSYTKVEYADIGINAKSNSKLIIENSKINSNFNQGIYLDNCTIKMKDSEVKYNGEDGIYVDNSTASIYDCIVDSNSGSGIWSLKHSSPSIGTTEMKYNGQRGLFCSHGGHPILLRSAAYPNCGYNDILENEGEGVRAQIDALPYLGKDSHNQGLNEIYDNEYYDVRNNNSDTLRACYNYWGPPPAPQPSQFWGPVDYSNPLGDPPDSWIGWTSPLAQTKQKENQVNSGEPDSGDLGEAYRLRNVAVDLFLDGEYYAAIDTFQLIIEGYPGSYPARFALNHIVVCYREAEDYRGAVGYLDDFLQELPDTNLVDLALYHKVLNLPWLQDYQGAVTIAGNTQLVQSWAQNLIEPTLIELGMIQKYGLQNVAAGDSVFRAFLEQYPESDLAPIAAMELGIAWEPRGTSGSGADGIIHIENPLPREYALHQNYPNPFNPATTIKYDLPELSDVKIEIFNLMGRRVVTLIDRIQEPGYRTLRWNRANFHGVDIASGVYIYRIQAKGLESGKHFTRCKKMILLK